MKGVSCILDAKMSYCESMMQMLQRRFGLQMKAIIYRKSNKSLKTQIMSCSQICTKLAVIRVGAGMTEVLQTEVTGEGALSHRLKADRKESQWEFQGWLYLESAKSSPFSIQNLTTYCMEGAKPQGFSLTLVCFDSHSRQWEALCIPGVLLFTVCQFGFDLSW